MSNLIEEFYNSKGKNYNISLEECTLICNSPFIFVKETIKRGILRNIRLQYFGVFEVSSSRLKYSKKNLEEGYHKGTITEERYKERIEILNRYES